MLCDITALKLEAAFPPIWNILDDLFACVQWLEETNNSTPHHGRAAAQWLNMTEVQYDLYPLECLMFVTTVLKSS